MVKNYIKTVLISVCLFVRVVFCFLVVFCCLLVFCFLMDLFFQREKILVEFPLCNELRFPYQGVCHFSVNKISSLVLKQDFDFVEKKNDLGLLLKLEKKLEESEKNVLFSVSNSSKLSFKQNLKLFEVRLKKNIVSQRIHELTTEKSYFGFRSSPPFAAITPSRAIVPVESSKNESPTKEKRKASSSPKAIDFSRGQLAPNPQVRALSPKRPTLGEQGSSSQTVSGLDLVTNSRFSDNEKLPAETVLKELQKYFEKNRNREKVENAGISLPSFISKFRASVNNLSTDEIILLGLSIEQAEQFTDYKQEDFARLTQNSLFPDERILFDKLSEDLTADQAKILLELFKVSLLYEADRFPGIRIDLEQIGNKQLKASEYVYSGIILPRLEVSNYLDHPLKYFSKIHNQRNLEIQQYRETGWANAPQLKLAFVYNGSTERFSSGVAKNNINEQIIIVIENDLPRVEMVKVLKTAINTKIKDELDSSIPFVSQNFDNQQLYGLLRNIKDGNEADSSFSISFLGIAAHNELPGTYTSKDFEKIPYLSERMAYMQIKKRFLKRFEFADNYLSWTKPLDPFLQQPLVFAYTDPSALNGQPDKKRFIYVSSGESQNLREIQQELKKHMKSNHDYIKRDSFDGFAVSQNGIYFLCPGKREEAGKTYRDVENPAPGENSIVEVPQYDAILQQLSSQARLLPSHAKKISKKH